MPEYRLRPTLNGFLIQAQFIKNDGWIPIAEFYGGLGEARALAYMDSLRKLSQVPKPITLPLDKA